MNKSLLPGIGLILLGVIFLLPNFFDLRGEDLWPLLVLAPGILFYIMFFSDRTNYGLLMPATVLTVSGLMFFYCMFAGWHMMRSIWPLFMVAPGIAFLLMYMLGRKERGLLIPGGILTAMGLIFLLDATEYANLWPIVLIIIGVIMLINVRKKEVEE